MKKYILLFILLFSALYLFSKSLFLWPPYITYNGKDLFLNFKTNGIIKGLSIHIIDKNLNEVYSIKLQENELYHMPINIDYVNENFEYIIKQNSKVIYKNTFNEFNPLKKDFTFVVYGDTRYYDKLHRMIVDKIIEEKPDFVINVGDMVENGENINYWTNFFNTIKGLNIPYFPIPGNHEKNSKYYYAAFILPEGGGFQNKQWYSFKYGNLNFILLDSIIINNSELFKQETIWLEQTLKNNKNYINIIIFHYPFWNNSIYAWRRDNKILEKKWRPIFEKYNVKLVFNGHVHAYERFELNGITYITTGGGGAPFDPGHKKILNPYTKKLHYGYLEYVLLKVKSGKITVITKAVGKSDNYKMNNVKSLDMVLDFFEIDK
ncbi:hypothetical protein XO10_02200 [Marinitoga sp. 1135]|uniref:metallophosphoesterase family protein n=1 Tax=Marinitoga sp. 1135 TaxID=1643333 RepID=UPI0015868BF2|nr:metallophosphoesterase [Marinitoga sp. 1135]NUU95107.1 hypothetical protein [Marinitoga sp. 1135]